LEKKTKKLQIIITFLNFRYAQFFDLIFAVPNFDVFRTLVKASVIGCPSCRGSLLTVHTQFQDNRLYDLVVASQGVNFNPFWLGARKYCTNCQFEYTDHSPFDFTNWTPGEPNNWGDGEECVEVSNIWGAAVSLHKSIIS